MGGREGLPMPMMPILPWLDSSCAVDRSLTPPVLVAELLGLALALAALTWLQRRLRERLPLRLLLMALPVLGFELFTAPMWDNAHLGRWAYLYRDVSWVLTLGWSVLFLAVVEWSERALAHWRFLPRFLVSLAAITVLSVPLEALLVALGVRGYAPEVQEAALGGFVGGVPLAIVYYVPVFATLVLGFHFYWRWALEGAAVLPMRRIHWRRGLLLTTAVVLLFELMVEPMVGNRGFPAWANLYRDINLVMSGVWVLVIAATALVVNRVWVLQPMAFRMVLAVIVATALALPIEYGLYGAGMRVYGPSAVANFSGFRLALIQAPVEIAFAIPCYMALVLATIRSWEIVIDNRF